MKGLNRVQDYTEKVKNWFGETFNTLKMLIFWLLAGVTTGCIVGITGVAFHYSIDILAEVRSDHPWLIYFLPLGGAAIVFVYNASKMEHDKGTNAVILAVREDGKLPFRTAPLIFLSTVITHFLGGSSGREGAALQIGGSISAAIGNLFKLGEKEQKIIVMAGMSACFSALFGTPVSAAIFSIEVISVGIMHYSAIVPCVTASIVAFRISTELGVEPTSFKIMFSPDLSSNILAEVVPFAVLCAFVCRFFCFSLQKTKKVFKNSIKNKYMRVLTGSVIIIIMTLVSGSQTFNGAGGDVIASCFSERAEFYLFIVKLLFTAVTLGCGFKGGEIIPAFFVGAAFGSFASPFFHIDFSFGAGIGLIALFCGATNCPLSSLLMSIELFGIKSVPYFAVVCGISYLVSGDNGLYSEQKIVYSKTRPEYINKTVKNRNKKNVP